MSLARRVTKIRNQYSEPWCFRSNFLSMMPKWIEISLHQSAWNECQQPLAMDQGKIYIVLRTNFPTFSIPGVFSRDSWGL